MANQDEERDDEAQDETDEGSEDEGSEDEGSEDEGSDEGSDDVEETASGSSEASDQDDEESSDDEEGSEPAAVAAAQPVSAPQPIAKSTMTPGARLAAAKAAKAAKKAVKKAEVAEARASQVRTPEPNADEEVDAVEQIKSTELGQATLRAQEWASANQNAVYAAVAAAVLAVAGWFGWTAYQESVATAAGTLLAEAVRISTAEIVAEDEADDEADDEGDDEADEPTFTSVEARNTAALAAYRAVIDGAPSSDAAGWARLGEARLLLVDGEPEDARAAFEAAISSHGADPIIAMRAYEGVGFTYEEEENWDDARESFERIRGLENGDFAALADFHLARIRLATGDEVGAQTALEELVTSIRDASTSSEPEFPYVLAQAQTLLRQLDPSSSSGSEAPAIGAGSSEEEIMEMIRRAMAGREGGAPPGAPPGGE